MLFQSCPNLNIHVTNPQYPHDWLRHHLFPWFNWRVLMATGGHRAHYLSRPINSDNTEFTLTPHIELTDPIEKVTCFLLNRDVMATQQQLNTAPYCQTFTMHSMRRE